MSFNYKCTGYETTIWEASATIWNVETNNPDADLNGNAPGVIIPTNVAIEKYIRENAFTHEDLAGRITTIMYAMWDSSDWEEIFGGDYKIIQESDLSNVEILKKTKDFNKVMKWMFGHEEALDINYKVI